MRRLPGVILSVGVLLVSGLTACGIPNETDVRVEGRGPVADTVPVDGPGEPPPPGRTRSADPEQFARNFLTAAAGEAGEVYKRVNEFIVSDKQFDPKPGNQDINVIRMLYQAPRIARNRDGTSSVKIEVQQIGVLRANGSIGEPVAMETSYSFTIGQAPTDPGLGDGLWVLDPPQVVLMTVDALVNYYVEHTIYFWNNDQDALIPDLRYLPRAVPVQRQATKVLDWLIGGPSDWLGTVAARLPDGTGVVGNVPAPKEGSRLEVNLSVKAGALETDSDIKKLYKQIAWSLRYKPVRDNELELKIQNQSRMVDVAADYYQNNPIYQLSGPATRYGVLAGSLYPLVNSDQTQPTPVPIPEEVNQNIVAAWMSRDRERISVALVSKNGESFRLRVGAGFGVAGDFKTTTQSYDDIGRPVWLKEAGGEGPTGLVAADGKLWEFRADSTALTEVPLPGVSGRVAAVAASLDGCRIAFVAAGALYVATVRPVDGTLNVGPARQLATSLRELSAVDWFGAHSLGVAGLESDGRAAIYRLSVDGAGESRQVSGVGATITELAAYPNDLEPQTSAPLVYEANQVAYGGSGAPITRDQVSPGSGTLPPGTAAPTAPFYLY